jgi:hypothetical protein
MEQNMQYREGGRWLDKLVARPLATAALWVRIQTYLKNTKWATYAKEWPYKKYTRKRKEKVLQKKRICIVV